MFPLRADIPARTRPVATIVLIVVNLATQVYLLTLAPGPRQDLIYRLAIIPSEITKLDPYTVDEVLYNGMTLLTAMFLHAGPIHLLGNMLYLWIFGGCIEDAMGHARFGLFYLACGVAASLAQIAASPDSAVPMVGASGAIAGILGAVIVMYPTARVLTLLILILIVKIVKIPALIFLGVWLLIQLLHAGASGPGAVAWFAHVGGFVAGVALITPLRRKRPRQRLF